MNFQENVRVGYKIVGFKSKPLLKFYSTLDDATTAIDNLTLTIIGTVQSELVYFIILNKCNNAILRYRY